MKLVPQKRFSQNFLTDSAIAKRIVAAVDLNETDTVLEIGPGTGALTKWLVESPVKEIFAVDVDQRVFEHLRKQPWFDPVRIHVILSDILKIDLGKLNSEHHTQTLKLVGNIPYSITSPILFWIFNHRKHIYSATIMMQREVARRCVAKNGTKDFGILSVATWFAAQAKMLFHVNPGAFFPRPSVTSSVVQFTLRSNDPTSYSMEDFMLFVRAAFSQRRKLLSNSLMPWLNSHNLEVSEMPEAVDSIPIHSKRAEELTPEQLLSLYDALIMSNKNRK